MQYVAKRRQEMENSSEKHVAVLKLIIESKEVQIQHLQHENTLLLGESMDFVG